MIRRPPRSTLFPYTDALPISVFSAMEKLAVAYSDTPTANNSTFQQPNPFNYREDNVRLDRKSTRLNSSHGYISYAVFCLKKKKNMPLPLLSHNESADVTSPAI